MVRINRLSVDELNTEELDRFLQMLGKLDLLSSQLNVRNVLLLKFLESDKADTIMTEFSKEKHSLNWLRNQIIKSNVSLEEEI